LVTELDDCRLAGFRYAVRIGSFCH
jgi:hypothetical protein